jgi:amino acid transporter
MAARILIQFIGHTLALFLIRARRPDIERPFKMPLYPLPAVVSMIGYAYVFVALGPAFMAFGVGTLALGAAAYLITARARRDWPFEVRRR